MLKQKWQIAFPEIPNKHCATSTKKVSKTNIHGRKRNARLPMPIMTTIYFR